MIPTTNKQATPATDSFDDFLAGRTPASQAPPQTADECFQHYAIGSSVRNARLILDMCETAFNAAKHPVDRARSLCAVANWHDSPSIPAMDVYHQCNDLNPLPACPDGMAFELTNMHGEVKCDGLKDYAPDSTGRSCYQACPNNKWPIYSGKVLACID